MGKSVFQVKKHQQRPIFRRRKIQVIINGKAEIDSFIRTFQHYRDIQVFKHQLRLLTDDHLKLWDTHTGLLESLKQGPEDVEIGGDEIETKAFASRKTHHGTPLEVVRDLSSGVYRVNVASETDSAFCQTGSEAHSRHSRQNQRQNASSSHGVFGDPKGIYGQANVWSEDVSVSGMHTARSGEGSGRTKHLEQTLQRTEAALKIALEELEDTKIRLSKLMGQRLTDNNPNITDLSDMNRPTKLAERFSELYDNQWTDAYEVLDQGDEQTTICRLLSALMEAYQFCKSAASGQMDMFKQTLMLEPDSGNHIIIKQLKDCRKAAAVITGKRLYQDYRAQLKLDESLAASTAVQDYLRECFTICWLMCVQDPPVVFAPCPATGEPFNSGHYRAFTRSGPKVGYVVWPVMLLYGDGPMICKGVAQGC